MFDSIKCHIQLTQHIDVSRFTHHRVVEDSRHGVVARHWLAKDNIHVNYRLATDEMNGVLSIEVPLSQWTKTPRTANPTMQDYQNAINRINRWLRSVLDIVTDIREWTVTRIDYCYNFDVENVSEYMLLLNQLHCGTLSRNTHEHGVTWKNDNRWVKFYDKGKQLGNGTQSTLRYEVTNHRSAVVYMCKHWFGCKRILKELLHPMRALYVLTRFYEALGLHNHGVYEGSVSLHTRLAAAFPTALPTALGMYTLITQYGHDAHKHTLCTRSMYYRWLRLMRTHHLLPSPTHTLPVLHINSTFFLQQHAQNVGSVDSSSTTSSRKIWGNFGLKIEPSNLIAEMLRENGELV